MRAPAPAHRLLAGALLAGALASCASPRPEPVPLADQLFARRQYAAATEAYERQLADAPDGPGADRALFYLALAASAPELGSDGARRAANGLRQLIERFPDSSYRASAEILLALHRRQQELAAQLDRLRRSAATLERQLEELKKIDLEKPGERPPR